MPATDEPLVPCPRCAGTGSLGERYVSGGVACVPCPRCTPFGPFGLVPETDAIESALCEETSEARRARDETRKRGKQIMDWFLRDAPVPCRKCDGLGVVNPGAFPAGCSRCGGSGYET